MRILVIRTARQINAGRSDRLGVDGRACDKHEGEGLAGFLLGSLNLRGHLEDVGVVGWIILKRILEAVRSWTVLIWPRAIVYAVVNLRVAASVGCLLTG
jgi:hypothetical protein